MVGFLYYANWLDRSLPSLCLIMWRLIDPFVGNHGMAVCTSKGVNIFVTSLQCIVNQEARFGRSIMIRQKISKIWRLSDIQHPNIHHLRRSSPPDWIQTFITLDFHHPLPKIRHSSPRHSSPQTFITHSCRIRHSSPRTFITSDVHHLRHSSPQTFITSDVHHP